MSPERKEMVNGKLVEEYYWAGELIVYVDHYAATGRYETVVDKIRRNEPVKMDARR